MCFSCPWNVQIGSESGRFRDCYPPGFLVLHRIGTVQLLSELWIRILFFGTGSNFEGSTRSFFFEFIPDPGCPDPERLFLICHIFKKILKSKFLPSEPYVKDTVPVPFKRRYETFVCRFPFMSLLSDPYSHFLCRLWRTSSRGSQPATDSSISTMIRKMS
jgi:hypothetical protein